MGQTVSRKQRIHDKLAMFEQLGIIRDVTVHGSMPGLRWVFTPAGHSERALSTSEVEDFILGVEATRDWLRKGSQPLTERIGNA